MRYTLLFAVLGLVLCLLALSRGGWSYLFIWPALDFLILAIGYGGAGYRVFGKSPDGSIPMWAKFVHMPFLVYTTAIWHAIQIISKENAVDEVADGIFLGRRLLKHETPTGIRNWVDLTAEFEDCQNQRDLHNYVCLPILDGTSPSVTAMSDAIARLKDGATFVHCAQGHGRSVLFVLALLAHRGITNDVEQGLKLIRQKRPGVWLNSTQLRFIHGYLENKTRTKRVSEKGR